MKLNEYFKQRKERQLQKKLEKAKAIAEYKENLKETIQIEKPKEPLGLTGQLKELTEKLDNITQEAKVKKDIQKKAFRLPFRVKSQLKKLAMKSKVQIILLQNNGNIKPTIAEIKCGMVMVGDKIYDGSPKGLWLWNIRKRYNLKE